jgi:hypothetical protein
MYTHDPRIMDLPCEPEDLVRVYRSMNMVKISLDDYSSEPCETYVVTSRIPGTAPGGEKGAAKGTDGANAQLQTHIVFYLEAPAVRAIFFYGGNPYPPGKRIEAESAAADMVEQMGAILEDTGWESISPAARVQWLSQEYLFRLGEKRPRPTGPRGGIGAVTPARKADLPPPRPAPVPAAGGLAQEVTGLETDFDALLDSAFFEGGKKSPAAVAATPVPPSPPPAKPSPLPAAPVEEPRPVPAPPAAAPPPSPPPASLIAGGAQARRACKFLSGF